MRTLGAVLMLASLLAAPAFGDPALDALVAAYPDHLATYDDKDLVWKDGRRSTISDGRTKTFEQLLDEPDIKDQFAIPYPLGIDIKVPAVNEDPGRIRNESFFLKMYGDCRKGEVTKHLQSVKWLPSRGGGTVMVTTVNGVADRLAEVSRELDMLPASMTRYMVPAAGTYNCRTIAATKRLSVHAYGAAIDLATRFGDYWIWSHGKDGTIAWKNRFPLAIVEIFERHGFIWGGKWYHFDSFHFEYRPEIITLAKQGWPRQ
jgi:hypothetical protein